jgi:hypothetical protein
MRKTIHLMTIGNKNRYFKKKEQNTKKARAEKMRYHRTFFVLVTQVTTMTSSTIFLGNYHGVDGVCHRSTSISAAGKSRAMA